MTTAPDPFTKDFTPDFGVEAVVVPPPPTITAAQLQAVMGQAMSLINFVSQNIPKVTK